MKSLALVVNAGTPLSVQVMPEAFVVESVRALFYHLGTSNFFHCDNGIFKIDPVLGTDDYTPRALRALLQPAMDAAGNLFEIKAFVTRVATSSLQSVLQEAIEQHVIVPFYRKIENIKSKTLLEFVFQAKTYFADLRNTLEVVKSEDPAEMVFALARRGSKEMLCVAVQVLHLFCELCRNAITIHNSSVLSAPDFFVRNENGNIVVKNLPSAVPMAFAQDVANAALSLIVIAPPMRIEDPLESMNVDVTQVLQRQDFVSFELLLPSEVPTAETPDEEISNFRAAAWSMSMPTQKKAKEMDLKFSSLDDAVKTVLVKPLWGQAKKAQMNLVEFLMKDQQALKVVELLCSLFLMKRGDLHNAYIYGDVPMEKAAPFFKKHLGSVPFFEYRFLVTGAIAVSVPHRLRRVITAENLKVYQNCYQWLLRIRKTQYSLLVMNCNKAVMSLRMKLIQFFLALHQMAIWQLEGAMFELVQAFNQAKSLDDLISAHGKFVGALHQVSVKPFKQVAANIDSMFEFCTDFCKNASQMNETEIMQSEQQFLSYKTFLHGFLSTSVRKNPDGIASALLNAVG